MIDVPVVREAIVAKLGAISNRITTYRVIPHAPVQLPCLLTYPPDTIDFRVAKGTSQAVFPVLALVGPQDPTAQAVLEALMSATGSLSVYAALTADRTLSGKVSNLRLLDMTSGAYSIGVGPDDNAIGAEFRVEVLA
ncbi:MAG: hypothetical protein IT196_05330 [Acidimicrobiales bacterium]|nr:hypothetical protein [Acidimicrobiales bacterium]